mgnify:CR=1 FL=1
MRILSDGTRVVWEPLKGSQTLAMNCPANVIVMHGTRGPGKTDAQLLRFRSRVGLGYGRHMRGIIFDREYKNLDDLVAKSMRWFPEFGDGARFISSKSDYKWVWPTGEELLFRAIKKSTDYWGYHGQEFPFIGWNELTKYPTDELFDAMMSCNRCSFLPDDYPITIDGDTYREKGVIVQVDDRHKNAIQYTLPEIPLEVFVTTNPYGAGHNWVKKRFINVAPMGKIVRKTINVFNPRTQKREDIIKTQVHIFGSYRENKYLAPEYVAELESITDKNKRDAWLKGSWDIVAGGMFSDLWDTSQHVVKPFTIPSTWKLDRSFDYGSSAPFSVGWWAESDGSDYVDGYGKVRSSVRGDLFRIGEWYGTSGKTNQGLRLLANEISKGIIEREIKMGIYGKVLPGPADNSIWDSNDGNSIGNSMMKPVDINGKKYKGVMWGRSNKSAGSRKAGWEKIRTYLSNALPQKIKAASGEMLPVPREKPGLFVFQNCVYFLDLFPVLPRDEDDQDDVDTDAEDHIGDEVRYRVLATGTGAKGGRTKGT